MYDTHMTKLVVFISLLLVVGYGAVSCSEPTPAPDVPMMAEGEIIAIVEKWVRETCLPDSFIYPYMTHGALVAEYIGDSMWNVGFMYENKPSKVFEAYEKSGTVRIRKGTTTRICYDPY